MRKPLSPATIQAFIWVTAAALVGLVVVVALAVNRPAHPPTEPPPPPAAQSLSPAMPAPVPDGAGQPTTPPGAPALPGPQTTTIRPHGPPGRRPPTGGSAPTKLTEDVYLDLAAMMILIAEATPQGPDAQKAMEQALKSLLIQKGVDEAAFRKYSDEVTADPKRRARLQRLVLMRADQLRVVNPTVRPVPGLGVPLLRKRPHQPPPPH